MNSSIDVVKHIYYYMFVLITCIFIARLNNMYTYL